jgi:hypothetical protein
MIRTLLLALFLLQGPAANPIAGGIVVGRILLEDGSPAVGVRVSAMPVPQSAGPASASVLNSITQTDKDGNYRLENIPPGPYYIAAGLVTAPTYYPGGSSPTSSSVVNVVANTPVRNIDFRIPHSAGFKVSGHVVGLPTTGVALRPVVTLLPRNAFTRIPFPMAPVKTDFTYEVGNIVPGDYSVQISGAGMTTMKDVVIVSVNKDLTGIDLVLVDIGTRTKQEGLDTLWSLPGMWDAVAADNDDGVIYASAARSKAREIDKAGNVQREVPRFSSPLWRLAHFSGVVGPVFLNGSGPQLVARDANGKILWTYPETGITQSADDVWPVDLDGDGSDEVVVGYNGGTGVSVFNSTGHIIWKSTTIGNVWHVSGGDVRGNGKPQVVTTSALGKVHIFSADLSGRVDLDPGVYANMVRVGRISDKDSAATIFAGGTTTDNRDAILTAMNADGVKKWTLKLTAPGRPSFYSAYLAPGKPWMVLTMQTGVVFVVDVERGSVIATIDGLGLTPEAVWLKGKDAIDPILVVAAKTSLSAYRVTGATNR